MANDPCGPSCGSWRWVHLEGDKAPPGAIWQDQWHRGQDEPAQTVALGKVLGVNSILGAESQTLSKSVNQQRERRSHLGLYLHIWRERALIQHEMCFAKVYDSLLSDVLTEFRTCYHSPVPEDFRRPQKKPVTATLLPVPRDVPVLGVSCAYNHAHGLHLETTVAFKSNTQHTRRIAPAQKG